MSESAVPLLDQAAESVVSRDGTRIGYRRIGGGPGVVLIQGSFGTQYNFAELARELAGAFTVYLPDRRGRGISPRPYDSSYSIERDVENLKALLDATGAERVFGLSSGAIVALWAASSCSAITRVAAFEPPLLLDQSDISAALTRFDHEVQRGDLAAAGVTGMLASRMGPALLGRVPRGALELMTRCGLWIERRRPHGPYAPMHELIPALRYDFTLIEQASRNIEQLTKIGCDVLLLGAEKSPAYLRAGLDAVQGLLPGARQITLAGVGHGAAWNSDRGGRPLAVAPVLCDFLA